MHRYSFDSFHVKVGLFLTMSKSVEFTEVLPEYPSLGNVIDERDPRARHRHHQVSNCQVNNVEVRRSPHAFVTIHNHDNQKVA